VKVVKEIKKIGVKTLRGYELVLKKRYIVVDIVLYIYNLLFGKILLGSPYKRRVYSG